jgi:hypothetical protein
MLEKNKLKITNIIMTGRLPVKHKLDFSKIIMNSKYKWFIATPENSTPICSTRFMREEENKNVFKHTKQIYISLWNSGAINFCGLKSFKEGYKYYNLIQTELRRLKEL